MNSFRRMGMALQAVTLVLLVGLGACSLPQTKKAAVCPQTQVCPVKAAALTPDFQKVAAYKFGESREALTVVAERVRKSNGKPQELKCLECQLTALLAAPTATYESKEFACRQLANVGSADAVPALAALLADEKLSNMARYALERIPGEAAGAALREALPRTACQTQIGVINSLGVRRDAQSVAALSELLGSSDAQLASAAARALGKIGDAKAADALMAAKAKAAGETLPAINDAYLFCADQLLADGNKRLAKTMYQRIYVPSEPLQVRLAALGGMVAADERKGAMNFLTGLMPNASLSAVVAALKSEDPKLQAAATRFVRQMKGAKATRTFVAQLPNLPPSGQVLLLTALADRGDKAALPAVAELAKSKDDSVRLAALKTLGQVGDASSVALLAQLAATAPEPEKTVAQESLSLVKGNDVNAAILACMKSEDPKVRVELVRALGARWAIETTPQLVQATQDKDRAVQTEAFKSLGILGEEKDLPALVNLVLTAKTDGARERAEKALISTCNRIEAADARTKIVLAAYSPSLDTPVRCALLRVLGGIGGAEAQKTVSAAVLDANPDMKDTAIRSLADWPDAGPVLELGKIAKEDPSEKYRVLALRGYVRQIAMPSERPADQTLAMYQNAMSLAQRQEDKKLVLAGLGSASDPQVLTIVSPYLDNADLQAEALASMLTVAKSLADSCPEMAKEAAARILEVSKDEEARKQAGEILESVKKYEDFITAWKVAGPYTEAGKSWQALYDVAFAPEDPKAQDVAWRVLKGGVGPDQTWCVNLARAVGGKDCVVYLRTNVWMPKAIEANAYLGSDDGIKVWINGELVHGKNVSRSVQPGEDQFKAKFHEGWNTLMLKSVQGDNDWGISIRFRNPDATATIIEGMRVKLDVDAGSPEPIKVASR